MYINLAIFLKLKLLNFWQFYLQKLIEFVILFFQNLARVPSFTQKERGFQISKPTHSILAIVFQIQEPFSLI